MPGMSTEILERGAESIATIISESLSGQRDRNFALATLTKTGKYQIVLENNVNIFLRSYGSNL